MKGDTSKTNIVVNDDTILTDRMIDYTGIVFNDNWIAVCPVGRNYSGRMLWKFSCVHCNNQVVRSASNIVQCTCDCQSKHHKNFSMSFYEWCKQNSHDDWIELWDKEMNKYDICDIGYGSTMHCWFKCNNNNEKHHSEAYILYNLTCGSQKGIVCKQCNSVAQFGIDIYGDDFLGKYWDYDLNDKSPWGIYKSSRDYIYLKCPNGLHGSHKTTANNACRYEYRCPYCVSEMKFSMLHTKVVSFFKEMNFSVLQEFDCNIVPVNPQTGYKLPYDIEITNLRLIVEVNGEQHYSDRSLFIKLMADKLNMTCEEAFAYRLWIDKYKKEYALEHGYQYLEIPFWLEKDDKFKEIIIDKINEIKTTYILPDVVNQG